MDDEKRINLWRKRCIKGGNVPIALVCVNKEGHPIVFTDHESEIMDKVFKHLAEAPLLGESTHFDNQEN
jgi:hypothetical protein